MAKEGKNWTEIPSRLKAADLDALVASYGIPRDLGVMIPAEGATASHPPAGYIALYSAFFTGCNFRLPMTRFIGALLQDLEIHISQVHPMGLARMTHFEFICKAQSIEPTPNRFHYFYKLRLQDSWFSFQNRSKKWSCCTKGLKSLHDWPEKFFFIKAGAIPIRMTMRSLSSRLTDTRTYKEPKAAWFKKVSSDLTEVRAIPEGALVGVGMSQC